MTDIQAAGNSWCSLSWSTATARHASASESDLLKYCFSSAYIPSLFRDGLHFPDPNTSIQIVNAVNGVSFDWTLGASLFQVLFASGATTPYPHPTPGPSEIDIPKWRTAATFYTVLFFLILTGFGLAFAFQRWIRFERTAATPKDPFEV